MCRRVVLIDLHENRISSICILIALFDLQKGRTSLDLYENRTFYLWVHCTADIFSCSQSHFAKFDRTGSGAVSIDEIGMVSVTRTQNAKLRLHTIISTHLHLSESTVINFNGMVSAVKNPNAQLHTHANAAHFRTYVDVIQWHGHCHTEAIHTCTQALVYSHTFAYSIIDVIGTRKRRART